MQLRSRIFLSLISIAVIPLMLFGLVAYVTSTNSLEAIERDALRSGLGSANQALSDIQNNLKKYLTDYTSWDELHNTAALDHPDQNWIKINLAPETPTSTYNTFNLDMIGLWNYQTKLLWSVGLSDDMSRSLASSIKSASTSGQPQTILVPSGSDIYLVGIAAIYTSEGKDPNGVLLFGRKLGTQDIAAISATTGYDVALYRGTRQVVGPIVPKSNPLASDLEAASTSNDYRFNQDREDFALAFSPIRNANRDSVGTLVTWRPRSALQASQQAIRFTLLFSFMAGTVLAIVVAFLLGSSIVSPLNRMAQSANLIAAGDLDQRIAISARSKDELNRLAEAFNKMTGQLASNIEALNHKVREVDDKNNALQIANAKAEETVRVRSEFLATMSHELRTPLNAIIGFSDTLLMGIGGLLNQTQQHQVERLKDNGKRLLALINDVLDISRIEAGRIELNTELFDPGKMITRIAAQTRILADQKQIEFVTEISPDLPPSLIGDEKRIEQVAVNLLSNAFKFTEKGTVSFKVGVRSDEGKWDMIVTDTGIGIPAHALDLIFEPFRQVDGSSKRAYTGSGLGLAITQQLVQSMGGVVTVQSQLNLGSTFTILLPMRMPNSIEQQKRG